MSQKPRSPKFESPSARLRLAIREKAYTAVKIRRGLLLLYRRNKGPGMWSVRVCGAGQEWTRKIAMADDRDLANGREIMNYFEAIDDCKRIADAGELTADNTVMAGLEAYKANLAARDKDPGNVVRILAYLSDKLARKHVATLTDADLKPFRDALLANMKPNSAKRTIKVFKAALNFIADRDRLSRRPWNGPVLDIEDSSDPAHNVILDDHDERAVTAAAHRYSEPFGLFVEILKESGARPSQAARLTAANVQSNFVDSRTGRRAPRLLMPVSKKGGGKKQITHCPVAISQSLADRLTRFAGTGLLFREDDGRSWTEINLQWRFACAIDGVKFNNPHKITLYALRHSHIVAQLLAGIPTAIVARLHDSSSVMIERHYSAFISDHTDALARAVLPTPSEVVPFDRRTPA